MRVLVLETRQLLLEAQGLVPNAFQEARLEHHVEHGVGNGHGKRVAAESRAVCAWDHALRRLFSGKERADGEPAADTLGDGHHIWRDAGPFVREQLAGAPHPALNLVKDQQQAVDITQLAHPLEIRRRDNPDAAFALYRLDHDRGRLRTYGRLERGTVAEWEHVEAGHIRAEPVEILLAAGSRDGRQRAPMEGALERDDALALGPPGYVMVAARDLDRTLAGLRPRVAEKYAVGERRRA